MQAERVVRPSGNKPLRHGARLEIIVQESTVQDEAGVREEIEQLLRRRHLTPFSVRVVSVEADPASGIKASERRGEARLVEWTRDGTLVPVAEVAQAWGIKRQSIDSARERGEIFSVLVRGQHWYPAEALKMNRQDFSRVMKALGSAAPTIKLLFLLKRHGALGERTPAEAVDAGLLADVLRLAQVACEG